jgi:hypothetical protein
VELTYDELLALPLREVDVTIACVSNEVGGDLVGTARWLGVPLVDVLDLAGVRADAEQLLGRSADGWTAGFPVALALDGRDALVAVGMQGETLPAVHGFPARLVVPGLYGYVSATKWLTELELTAWDGVDGYWIPRGWAKEAPVKTASRIDVPRPAARACPPATSSSRGSPGPRRAASLGSRWRSTRGMGRGGTRAGRHEDTWVQWRADVPLARRPAPAHGAGHGRRRARCSRRDLAGPPPTAPRAGTRWTSRSPEQRRLGGRRHGRRAGRWTAQGRLCQAGTSPERECPCVDRSSSSSWLLSSRPVPARRRRPSH